MGKKGGNKGAAKAGQQMSNNEFDELLNQLNKATSDKVATNAVSSKKDHKKERKEKLAAIKRENQAAEEQHAKNKQQIQQFMEMLRRQQFAQGDHLDTPTTKKETDLYEDDNHMVASVGMQGWRKGMEDAHIAKLKGDDDEAIYAVFDGHSGAEVAKFAAEKLETHLKGTEEWAKKDYEAALKKGFLSLDGEMRKKEMQAGSTATVCVVTADKIYTANSGDSRAVVCQNKAAVALSEDHKPMSEVEKTRIEKAGSTVEDIGGIGRVDGMLAVSRGFGDFKFKKPEIPAEEQAVTCFPDVTVHHITPETQYLIVACDGIWDCLTSEEVVEQISAKVTMAKTPAELGALSGDLMDELISPKPAAIGSDNMSIVLVKFKK
eukprot:TRINITY_DN24230_c0_g1_i1.p1 TRINITY_DN24230_c0_g1~~TRINITY_DN24230_c0_g1_i1.p1  ORF type:complete len:387 (+),score=136.48 TRINITY_DN24230_c0_g1_i1:31-1161(+)